MGSDLTIVQVAKANQVALIAALSLLLCILICLQLYWTRPVALPDFSFGDDESRILRNLNRRDGEADIVPAGYEQKVVRLTGPKGASVDVIVKEGLFTSIQIGERETWARHLHDGDYLLIDPVDEKQNKVADQNSLAGIIASGCELTDWVGDGLKLGQVTFHDCNGQYSKQYGAGAVASAASVIWEAAPYDPQPCENKVNEPQQANCTADAVNKILKSIFEQTNTPFFTKHTWVLPSLGTGHGHLPQDRFYELVALNLAQALGDRSAQSMDLLLLVKRGDQHWKQNKQSIAHRFAAITTNAERQVPSENVLNSFYLAGALLGVALWLVALQARLGLPSLAESGSQISAHPWAIVSALVIASWGLCSGIKQGLAFGDVHPPVWAYFAIGTVAIFIYLPLSRSLSFLKKLIGASE